MTEHLTLDELKALADDAQVPYEAHDEGIDIQAAEDGTAAFWRERGELWGRGRDFDDDNSFEDSDHPADQV